VRSARSAPRQTNFVITPAAFPKSQPFFRTRRKTTVLGAVISLPVHFQKRSPACTCGDLSCARELVGRRIDSQSQVMVGTSAFPETRCYDAGEKPGRENRTPVSGIPRLARRAGRCSQITIFFGKCWRLPRDSGGGRSSTSLSSQMGKDFGTGNIDPSFLSEPSRAAIFSP
jgi:hypothetical protein